MVILDDVDGYPCPPCMCIAETGTTRDFTIGLRGSQLLILFQLVILQYVPKVVVMDRIEQDKYRTGQLTFKYDIQLSKQKVYWVQKYYCACSYFHNAFPSRHLITIICFS